MADGLTLLQIICLAPAYFLIFAAVLEPIMACFYWIALVVVKIFAMVFFTIEEREQQEIPPAATPPAAKENKDDGPEESS